MPATGDRHRMVADAPRRQQKTMEPALKRCKPNEQEELIDKIAEQPVLPQEMALEDANILTMPAEDDELPSEPPQPKDEDDGHHHHHAAPATNTVAKPPTPECRDEHGTTYYGMEQGKRWRSECHDEEQEHHVDTLVAHTLHDVAARIFLRNFMAFSLIHTSTNFYSIYSSSNGRRLCPIGW
jgi:hypothetical protein